MENYPVIALLHRHGKTLALLVALLPFLGAATMVATGFAPWPAVPCAALAGAVIYVLARSYVELIHIITETLMPR